jgi:hypothetical protein
MALFVGDEKSHTLKNRVIYQVVGKEEAPHSTYSHHTYRYRVAFDLANPLGTSLDDTHTGLGTRGMKKLSLVDVGTLRLRLDSFLKEWARWLSDEEPP